MKEKAEKYTDNTTKIKEVDGKLVMTDKNGKNPVVGFYNGRINRETFQDILCIECAFDIIEKVPDRYDITNLPDSYQPMEFYIYDQIDNQYCDICSEQLVSPDI